LPTTIEQYYHNDLEIYTVEAQQLWQTDHHSLTAGGRYQTGDLETDNFHTNAVFLFPFLFPTEPEHVSSEFQRWSLYAYYRWSPVDSLQFIGGVSYDNLTYPANFRFAPLADGENSDDQFSPKGGVIWTPTARTTLRGGYAQSLGGVSFDQSFRLEPTQVAGFNQAFRSLIPEAVVGANAGARFENAGVALEQRFGSGTYLALSGEWLESEVDRWVGVYDFVPFTITPSQTREELDYRERSLAVSLHQLLGKNWALGARYRLSQAELENEFVDIPDTALGADGFQSQSDLEAILHQVQLFAIYNHPSGFFGRLESLFFDQNNQGDMSGLPGDKFWQVNLYAGYRFIQRRGEVTLGVLNLGDQDYRLNPLNLTGELPRDRTFMARLRFEF
jgi:outer membrane receptor protein involved in Fe transport